MTPRCSPSLARPREARNADRMRPRVTAPSRNRYLRAPDLLMHLIIITARTWLRAAGATVGSARARRQRCSPLLALFAAAGVLTSALPSLAQDPAPAPEAGL